MRPLHLETSPEALGFARFVVYGLWFVLVAIRPLDTFGELPLEWFDPLGPARLLPDWVHAALLQPAALKILQVSLLVLCALLAVGVRPFLPLGLACAVLLFLFDSIPKGFGSFVNHAQSGILLVTFVLPFFPAADGFSLFGPAARKRAGELYAAPMLLIGICISLFYMMLGIRRVFHGGLDVFIGDAILVYFSRSSLNYSHYGFDLGLWPLMYPALLAPLSKIGFVIVTVAEILAPLALFHRPFRWAWLAVIGFLHVSTLFVMNIFFWEQLILVLVFMTPVAHVFAPGRASPAGSAPVVFYDGVCGLCDRFVRFVLKRDRVGLFRFAPLQGETAAQGPPLPVLPAKGGDAAPDAPRSVILRDGSGDYTRSEAALRVVSNLGGIWRSAELLRVVPRAWRDGVYDFVARNRYRWFGKYDACPLPDPAVRERYLP